MDLKIQTGQLSDRSGTWEIALTEGYITEIATTITRPAKTTIDAAGARTSCGSKSGRKAVDAALMQQE